MTMDQIPKSIDPRKFADRSAVLQGQINISELPNVKGYLFDDKDKDLYLEVALRFSKDDQKRSIIEGDVKGVIYLVCQRCLGSMEYSVDSSIYLAVIDNDDDASLLPDQLEPLVLNRDDSLTVGQLIEEEILLSLPLIAKHNEAHCKFEAEEDKVPVESDGSSDPENPFSVLESLKTRD